MLQGVDVGRRSIDSYHGLVPDDTMAELRQLGDRLRGARVLQLNATAYGGGVAELLRSEIPLLRDLGVDAEWRTITAETEFFDVTKGIHNALQGGDFELSDAACETFLEYSQRNAKALEGEYDFIVVHDPQPIAIRQLRPDRAGCWIWRCHLDTSEPHAPVWDFIRPYAQAYDAAVFTLPEFVPPDLDMKRVETIMPAIDPLSPKSIDLSSELADQILSWIGVDTHCPLICQVARFDPWKDPHGVFDAYEIAKGEIPDLQLALVGSMASDDPEGWRIYNEIVKKEKADPDAFVFTNMTGVGNVEVNAFQRLSNVVVQKSIREGFGLVVSEALWKGTAVVAGRAGGIPKQVDDGESGYLVDGVEECAARIVELIRHPDRAAEMGAVGRERVRERFLLPRMMRDELRLLASLA